MSEQFQNRQERATDKEKRKHHRHRKHKKRHHDSEQGQIEWHEEDNEKEQYEAQEEENNHSRRHEHENEHKSGHSSKRHHRDRRKRKHKIHHQNCSKVQVEEQVDQENAQIDTLNKSASVIQSAFRGSKEREQLHQKVKYAIKLQCIIRGHQSRAKTWTSTWSISTPMASSGTS